MSNKSTVSTKQSASSIVLLDDDIPPRLCGCAGDTRFGILIISLIYCSLLMSSVIAYYAAYVSMMDKTTSPLYNGTNLDDPTIDWASPELSLSDRRFSYGFMEKSISFAGVYAGSIIGTFPIKMLQDRHGAHKVMFGIGVMSTTLVAITPIVVYISFPLFVVVRFISGFAMSNLFPVSGVITNEWAATKEKGLFVAVLSAFVELSAIFTFPLSGIISKNLGWPCVFYIHAVAVGLLTALWGLYYRDKPIKHPFVEAKEHSKISSGKLVTNGRPKTPISRILHSLSIWAVWIAVLGNFLVAQFQIAYSTLYLTYVLGFTPVAAGLITMIPQCLCLVIKFITGLVSDKISCINELGKVKLFNSLALCGSGVFFILLSVFEPFGTTTDVILVAIPISLLGFSAGGYPKAVVLVSRQHSPFVMSIVQIMAMLALTVGSFIVPAMTSENTFASWRNVFIFYGAVLVICNTIFIAFARTEPAKWSQTVAPSSEHPTTEPPHIIAPDSLA